MRLAQELFAAPSVFCWCCWLLSLPGHSGGKPGKYVLFVLFPFFLISYLCLCKGVGSTTVHSWNRKDLQGSYLGWDDRSGSGHSEMRSARLIWPSLSHRGKHETNNRFIKITCSIQCLRRQNECFVALFHVKEHFHAPVCSFSPNPRRGTVMHTCTIDAGMASATKTWGLKTKSLWLSCNLWPPSS